MESININNLIEFRKNLHKHPELSGIEIKTAQNVKDFVSAFNPDKIIENLGGHGIAFIYDGLSKGKTIMLRCELDGILVDEQNEVFYKSINKGISHSCGHDGHMAIMAGVAQYLSKNKIAKGRVVLLFQAAEENGAGAKAVIEDPKFKEIEPDYIFALHNLPGFEKHKIILKETEFASASKGMKVKLKGKSSHASEPENGISPDYALSLIINEFKQFCEDFDFFCMVTIIYAHLGEKKFGINPSELEFGATFRAFNDKNLDELSFLAAESIKEIAKAESLSCEISWHEEFPATVNNNHCVEIIENSAKEIGLNFEYLEEPLKFGEDFGYFLQIYNGSLFGLGSGTEHPRLHYNNYDFPDELIKTGIGMFTSIINILGVK